MDTRDDLLKAFGVGPEDLAANRSGRLGPHQRRTLERQVVVRTATAVAALTVPLALALLGPLWTRVAGVALVTLVALGLVVRAERLLNAARQPGVVSQLSGPVTPMLLHRENAGWWLSVQGRWFRSPVDVTLFDDDTVYRVYYLRSAHRVVAVEPAHR
jgi:hypothetical protein